MRQMGLQAIYSKPRRSVPAPGHRTYPYLLRVWKIERPDQVWVSETSPSFACGAASSIWSPSWIGTAVTCCPAKCRSVWNRASASRPCRAWLFPGVVSAFSVQQACLFPHDMPPQRFIYFPHC
ncbi:MAG: hypothetical protein JRJ26_20245 [Deltaproteobacteria bacterium]|nr:hypothetical protein [Deltaproteobacteria bacterium]